MRKLLLTAALLALAGCSLKTQTVHLDAPSTDHVVGQLKPVVIDEITDARDFNTIPENSGPRLDPAIAQSLGAEGRAKAISGLPRGPLVTLNSEGQVTETIRTELAATLRSHGYQVVAATDAPADAPHVRAVVKEFWAYMPFSFGRSLTWTNQLKAWVTTDVVVKTNTIERQFTVAGYGAHIIQSYKPENIKQALDLALVDYRAKLDAKLFDSLDSR